MKTTTPSTQAVINPNSIKARTAAAALRSVYMHETPPPDDVQVTIKSVKPTYFVAKVVIMTKYVMEKTHTITVAFNLNEQNKVNLSSINILL